MRFPVVLLAAAICAMAQGRGGGSAAGGMPGAHFPAAIGPRGVAPFLPQPLYNPFPFPTFAGQLNATINGWPAPSPGFGTFPRGKSGGFGGFGGLGAFGNGFAGFGGGYYGGGASYPPYPPYPPSPPPQSNMTLVLPPQPAPPRVVQMDEGILAPTVAPAAITPGPERVAPTEFPAIVSVKDGWTYSATSYWTKGSTFHFITTSGQHLQIPMSRLERLYPAQKDSRSVASPGVGR